MVQSSRCASAPSGSMDMARTLRRDQDEGGHNNREGRPFVNAKRLRKLILELCALQDVKLREEDEGAVVSVACHVRGY